MPILTSFVIVAVAASTAISVPKTFTQAEAKDGMAVEAPHTATGPMLVFEHGPGRVDDPPLFIPYAPSVISRQIYGDRAAAPLIGPVSEVFLEQKGYSFMAIKQLGIYGGHKPGLTGNGRVLYDSTRLTTTSSFKPREIPVEGALYYDSGWHAHLLGDASILTYDFQGRYGESRFRVFYANDFIDDDATDGEVREFGYRLRHAYGQVGGLVGGQTFSLFTDVNALGENITLPLPASALYLLQPQISYRYTGDVTQGHWWAWALGLGKPGAEIRSPVGFASYARFPELLANAGRYDAELGFLQVSTVARSLAIEADNGTIDRQVVGWAIQFSGGLLPEGIAPITNALVCRLTFCVSVGEGYGHYHTDLAAANFDAILNARGDLHALPLFTVRATYVQPWTPELSSAVSVGYVDLDSEEVADPTAYRRTRFASVNVLYSFTPSAAVGVEYFYGHKETLGGAEGEAHRLGLVVSITTN